MRVRELRIYGVYEQSQAGRFMLRIKVPGGVLSAAQAEAAADLSASFGNGVVHLTTRMSLELHEVAEADLSAALGALGGVGLTSRGACGGAVRGVAVSTPLGPGADRARDLARRIHGHFTGNPEFEGLPKKFKVGVDGGYVGARHLIQDVGLVLAGEDSGAEGGPLWDVWLAGGLGREPTAAFLFARALPEAGVIPLVADVVRLYKDRVPPGKRLKHLVRAEGRGALESALGSHRGLSRVLSGLPPVSASTPGEPAAAVARVTAGELPAAHLRTLAALARRFTGGFLSLTPDQDVALFPSDPALLPEVREVLQEMGLAAAGEGPAVLRVCPGSPECRVGLTRTREVARALAGALGPRSRSLSWAVSGCPNSCAQPQLADVGVVCVRLARGEEPGGERRPLFDLLRREGEGLGEAVLRRVPLEELLEAVTALG
ncbi:MAG: nitrite/sulfite reductase [Deferrisomatales bacterium]|nr:nitrite/sulfite reductase [Deferrisomatales bacterium]